MLDPSILHTEQEQVGDQLLLFGEMAAPMAWPFYRPHGTRDTEIAMLTERMTAKDVLVAHWDGDLPVRPVAIASAMGVEVFKVSGMEESGCISLDEDGQPKIIYNADEVPVRQRFTIAHELGHYALGHLSGAKTMWRDPMENFYSSARNPKEVEANRFAARLLMPADAVRLAVRSGTRNISELAQLFHVSEVAMKYRLINLGMLNG